MIQIKIDEEVQTLLRSQAKGVESPDETLRRLLGLDSVKKKNPKSAKSKGASIQHKKGTNKVYSVSVRDLLAAGLVSPGDQLLHYQPTYNREFHAQIEPDGRIRTEVKSYNAPSTALTELRGTSANGWKDWEHTRSGRSLSELRDQLRSRRRP